MLVFCLGIVGYNVVRFLNFSVVVKNEFLELIFDV